MISFDMDCEMPPCCSVSLAFKPVKLTEGPSSNLFTKNRIISVETKYSEPYIILDGSGTFKYGSTLNL
jgi:hypothetical protein